MRARLLAEGGTIRASRREPRLPLFALGVLFGILFCLALSVWQTAHREAERERGAIVLPLTQPREASRGVTE
jgi:hypothetical protein